MSPRLPSKSCQPCRMKRRKCDFKVPTCSQCLRAKVTCTGYRDSFSLFHRNENQLAATRVKDRMSKRGMISCPSEPRTEQAMILSDQAQNGCTLSPEPSLNPEDMALAYFINAYAPSCPFDYLPAYIGSLIRQRHVRTAILAPALVLLSRDLQEPSLLPLARNKYTKTLALTNAALSSPQMVTRDDTLLFVLLLSTYESQVFRERRSPSSWNAHIEGAGTLLVMRGQKQFQTRLGWDLFHHASGHIRVSRMARGIKTPPALSELEVNASDAPGIDRFAVRCGLVVDNYANVLDSMRGPAPDPTALITTVLELSAEVEDVARVLKTEVPYKTVNVEELKKSVSSFGKRAYQYSTTSDAKRWIALWILRLTLNLTIYHGVLMFQESLKLTAQQGVDLNGLPPDSSRASFDADSLLLMHSATLSRIQETILHVLCSVPYLSEIAERPSLSGRLLIWPLSMIASCKAASPPMKDFALDRLKFLGNECNLEHARVCVAMLLEKDGLDDWVHLSFFS